MRPRQIAPVALFLALTVAGFIIARVLAERDVRRDSEQRAEVAAAQIRGSVAQAASLTESLRRFMLDASGTGVTSDEFARNALRWLSPARFPAAAWVEQIPDSRRPAYERRTGQPIVTPDDRHSVVPHGSRSAYLPATLVSGFPPMAVPGTDLSGAPGMATVLTRATRLDGVAATPMAPPRTGTSGLFLVAPAPNLIGEVLRPGYVVVFASDLRLRAAATDAPTVRIRTAGTSTEAREPAETASKTFTAAGQRFDVVVPRESVQGAAAVLPWIILAGGLVVAALGGALGLNAARRARAQDELDRIFTLSSDLITVANFNGYFTRVNPAAERVLGYTETELLARPYLDLVHPDDREKTAAEAAAIGEGKATLSFENRYLRKDGAYRLLEWTVTPVVEEGVMYGVARDVTERRQVEAEAERLAEEQAALQRVATLVARDAPQAEVFTAIAIEIGKLLGTEVIRMVRYEDDRTGVVVASAGKAEDLFPVGSRVPLEADSAASRVFRTGEPVRIEDYAGTTGPVAQKVQSAGIRAVVATPIVVEGRLWGAMTAGATQDDSLPPGTESRLGQFTELMATAIGNTESHARADRLAEEQAALRRVATIVAQEAPPAEVFAKVAEELANVLGDVECSLFRDEGDGTASLVALSGARIAAGVHVGMRVPVDGDGVIASVLRERRPSRIGDYSAVSGAIGQRGRELGIRSAVGCPIMVRGRIWGAMGAARYEAETFSPEAEARLAQFAELVATAIANADARAEVERLAKEQAALRRVATLVAERASPAAVLDAVAGEMEALLDADQVALNRFEPGDEIVVLAHRGLDVERMPVGSRMSIEGESVTATVWRTGRPARMENYDGAQGALAELARATGLRSSVSAPIVVEGRLWGLITASWKGEQSPPAGTEQRMAQFAQLLDTATANAEARAEVMASRARLVAASDDARRRFERDLHDGVQQRLVLLSLQLRSAEALAPPDNEELAEQLTHVGRGLAETLDDLRELSRGIHPAILSEGGLVPALKALARRSAVPVQLDLAIAERLSEQVEIGAYYVVSEALTNAAKHARASRVEVHAGSRNDVLELSIEDDGVGGANPSRGSGLTGLADRVEALGGTIAVASPPGGGTSVRVEFSLDNQ